MPVSEQTPVSSYIGNGVATTFAYTYKIFAVGDLKVTVDGVLKTLTTDYTVTGAGQSGGGTVVFVNPPAVNAAVVIYRDLAFSRSTDYVEGGDLLAQTVDDDFDRAVMVMQQLKDDKNRALKLAKGETADQVITQDAAGRADKVIGFDALGALALKAIADLGGVYTIGDGLQLSGSDLKVAADVVRTALHNKFTGHQTFQGRVNVASSVGGTVDAITAVHSPTFTAWVDKMRGTFRAGGANTTTTPTFTPDGLPAKTFVKENLAALAANDISGAGHEVEWIYNSTVDKVILLNPKYVGIIAATQAEQEAGSSIATATTPGRQQYHPSAAKAWVVFNGIGTPAVIVGYNVSSITDVGIGNYTVNFTTPFSSANFACVGTLQAASDNLFVLYFHSWAVSSVGVYTLASGSGLYDATKMSVVCYGDQ